MNMFFAAACLLLQSVEPVAPRSQLDGIDGTPTQIAVLGTPHLSEVDGYESGSADALVDRLAAWQPDLILIEQLPAYQIETMLADPAFDGVAESFAGTIIDLASTARTVTGLTRPAAETAIAEHLERGPDFSVQQRRDLALLYLAAGDPSSAALQWMYLSPADREPGDEIDSALANALSEQIASDNETVSIAGALAHRLGLQNLIPFDSHLDKEVYLSVVDEIGAAFQESRVMSETMSSQAMADFSSVGREITSGNTLLDVYRRMNSRDFQTTDITLQWASFVRADMNGFGRVRMALWESRNLTMAAQARLAMAEQPGARVLIIVGAAHKPFLEDLLARSMDTVIVDIGEILE